ncbi:phage tail spike protein [Streptococcus agalactiae]|uniref:phage tail spike protein n=1 Tax=Streptococcus agalactiae TaxID=1311 RepID=UPI00085C9ADE|nr:phage tail spike protein [Streptococcus agalactiae]
MLLTIHDANLQKVAFIDNDKQSTLNYYGDTWTRDLPTGSSTFEFTVYKKAIKSDTASQKTYNYLNEKAFVSFQYHGKSYVFSVMTVEENEQTIKCYCENLNLELINEYANPYKATKAMSFVEYCNAMDLLNFTYLSVGINEISDQKRTLEWEGQDTKLARLLSLATKFDAEIDFDTELNADSSIKAFKVNVYHEYDDNHQGVGRVRNDIQLTYGKNLKSIKRKIDKTGIYNAIRPTGKGKTKNAKGEEVETVVTIGSLGAWSENNADGVREFYQRGEMLYAPLSMQMYPSAFTSKTTNDQWIRKDIEVDSDNPTVIRAAGIRDLKKNAYPALTYEVDGFIGADIGDTIRINDDGFNPILLIKARVSYQKISFTNPKSNKTTFSNFKALENILSDGIQEAFERLFEAAKPYTIKLSTDNGVIFKNQIGESLITPSLYKGGKPVVAGVTWRWSLDGDVTTGMTYLVKGSSVVDTVTLTVAAYIGNDEVAVDEISLVNVVDGELGTPGTPGQDGRTPYVHTAWANNETGTVGFSLDSSINKLYMGIYTDFEPTDSKDPEKYKWTRIKGDKGDKGDKGLQGIQGVQGLQGIPGAQGADGRTQYTHIAYADNATGGGFSQTDQTKSYIGMYVDFSAADSTNPAAYKWSKWKGEDGAQGIPGAKGADGRTPYVHFAYAESADGRIGFSTSQTGNKRYLGTYTDYTQADSTDPTRYKWVDMVGTVEVGGRNLLLNSNFEKVAKGNRFTVDSQVYDTTAVNWTTYNGGVTNATTSYHAYVADFEGRKNAVVYNETNGSRNWKGIRQPLDDRMPQTTNNFILSADVFVTGAGTKFFGGFYYFDKSGKQNFHSGQFQFDTSSFEIGKWQRVNVAVPFDREIADFSRVVNFYIYAYGFSSNVILAIDDVQLETGNVATYHSLALADIQVDIDSKADQSLTQEQLNALNERNQILEAEMQAKASMEAFSELEKAYNSFVAKNEKDVAQSEKDLIEAGRRIELLTTQFGGLAELKTFIDTYMKSTNEGLIIGKNDASSTIKVSSDRISMFSAGKEVMYISQGVIHIDNGIFTASVQIGKFRTEQYHLNADMNVIRYVG